VESPIKKIQEWYLSLPEDQRVDIAALVGSYCLDIRTIELESEEIVNGFLGKIERSQVSSMQEVGMSVVLKAGIEFFIINKRKDESSWAETKKSLEMLAERSNSETFRQKALEVDFRAKQWAATCKKWAEIKPYLAEEYLDKYMSPIGN